jgi:signal transduction histidine kinase/DNA-binding response OmpR family regulator
MRKSTAFIAVLIFGFLIAAVIVASVGVITYATLTQLTKNIPSAEITADNAIRVITGSSVLAMVLILFLLVFNIIFINRSNKFREELIEAKESAEKLSRMKEEFMTNMSHEIRTPMNVIMGFTEQLMKPSVRDKEMYLMAIRRSSEHLLRLINDILDFSKIESGKLNIEAIGFYWRDILHDVYLLLKEKAETKGLQFNYRVSGEIPEVIVGDPVRLKQVLINLIDNAIKFTNEGFVTILCEAENQTDKYLDLKFTVKDTGIGINKNKSKEIFEEFSQADAATTRKFGGSGLGLSICKKLVELQGGEINVQSIEGKGSEFSFFIPYKTGKENDLENECAIENIDVSELKGKKILVVDDEEFNRKLARIILEQNKVQVEEASGGKEALFMMQNKEYDLVLMDIQMPELNGLEAVREIRRDFKNADIPVIAVTANARVEDKELYLAAGMSNYLSKPFKENELLTKVMKALNLKTKSFKKVEEFDATDDEKLFDLEELKKITRGDEQFLKRILELFLENTPESIDIMLKATSERDWNKVGMLAHKMRPSFSHMGIKDLAALLKKIEDKAAIPDDEQSLVKLVRKFCNKSKMVLEQLEELLKQH